MTNLSVLRFSARNGRSPEPEMGRSTDEDGSFASSDPQALALRIASDTINQLIELQLVAAGTAPIGPACPWSITCSCRVTTSVTSSGF